MSSPTFAAVLVMAGSGSRFGGPVPKVYAMLGGHPLWEHAARTLLAVPGCRLLVVVVAPDRLEEMTSAARRLGEAVGEGIGEAIGVRVVAGGERRQDSVRHGLAAIDVGVEVVAVHDAARPLVRRRTVALAVESAAAKGAVLVAAPVSDTIKEVDTGGAVTGTPDRARLWRAQTPQCFRLDVLLRAHEQALRDGVAATDDAALVELAGHRVDVVRGDAWNLKVTEAEDLIVAEALLARRGDDAERREAG